MRKMTTCLWFDRGRAREAAEFYAATFPDSHVGDAHASPNDNPSAKAGEELAVEFTVLVDPVWGLLDMSPEGRGDFFPKIAYE